MAGSDKTVKVTLVAQTAPYAKGMAQASTATRKLGSDIDGINSKTKGLESGMGKASGAIKGLAIAGAAAAGTALVAFLGDAVQAAGDLEQSVGGVDAVFKDSAGVIHDFGKNAAENVGLSTNAFNELITVTGAMLKNKGLDDFAQKSLDLVQIGADLSATYGGSAKDAVEALNAAMRGESDPIERYGISINETAVNAELAAKGLNKLTGQALEQAKAQARIDIITRQSADALGKFSAEADTLQGQQQRLNAEWENAKASLGQALLPALTKASEAMRDGVDAALAVASVFEKIPGPVKAAVGALIALHLLKGPLGGFFTSTISQVKTLTTTLKGAGIAGSAKAAGSALMGAFGGPLGIAVGLGAAALTHWWEEAEKTNQIADTLKGTIDKATGAFTEQSKATIKDAILGDLSTDDIKRMQELGVSFDDLADAALKGGPELERMRQKLDGLKNFDWLFVKDDADIIDGLQASLGRAADGAERSKVIFGDVPGPAKNAADAIGAIAGATSKAAGGIGAAAQAADEAADSIDVLTVKHKANEAAADILRQTSQDLASALLDVKSAAGDADAAEIAYQQSLDDAQGRLQKRKELLKELKSADKPEDKKRIREELEQYTLTLDINTEAGRKNKGALIDLANQAKARSEANLKDGDAVDKVTKSMATAREEFINTAKGMGASKAEAEKLADQYGLTKGTVDELKTSMDKIPKKVVSDLEVQSGAAKTAIDGVNALLTALEKRRVVVNVTASVSGVANSINNVGSLFGWNPVKKAGGGPIPGFSPHATADNIPVMATADEYMIRRDSARKLGKAKLDWINATGTLPPQYLATGGFVSRMPQQVAAAPQSGADGGPGIVMNVNGSDPLATARHAVDELEWRVVNG